jgi:hypothetical protein
MQALRPKLWAPLVLVLGGAGAFAATRGAPVEAADHNDPPNRVHSATPTADDREADIADVFVWTRGAAGPDQTTVFAMSFDGPNAPGSLAAVPCDRDVLYQIHITSNGGICPTTIVDDLGESYTCGAASSGHPCGQYTPTGGVLTDCAPNFADMHTINVRFAPNGEAATATCVVQAEFVAGDGGAPIAGTIAGEVETDLVAGSNHLFAGLRDDAFFFDLAGFQATLAMADGHSHFTGGDSFANQNTPVIVLEVPTSAISHSAHALPPGSTSFRVWGSTSRFHEHT